MNQPVDRLPSSSPFAAPAPRTASQATLVEQHRAVAEVQAAVTIAHARPRELSRAVGQMREACAIVEMANQAFWRFPRGGQQLTGETVQLARELARCYGNIDYGIKELARDNAAGQSEMMAYAWDMENNARASTTFIVPHLRDKKGGAERLTEVRDIYEINANMGARRLREMIFAILPRWFTEQAVTECHKTLEAGGGEPMPLRIEKMLKLFATISVTKQEIELKIEQTVDKIDPVQLAQLQIVFNSIRRGEVTKEEEFPSAASRLAEAKAKQEGHSQATPFATAPKAAAPAAEKVEPLKMSEQAAAFIKLVETMTTAENFTKAWNDCAIEVNRELGPAWHDEQLERLTKLPAGQEGGDK